MTSGVQVGYEPDGLRAGGAQAGVAGDVARGAAELLRPVSCSTQAVGLVAGADALTAAVARLRDAHVALAERVGAEHADLASRAGQVAVAGDGLTAETAAVAAAGAPGL